MSWSLIAVCLATSLPAAGAEESSVQFAAVREVFADHCYACHGSDGQEGGLRLDRRDSALQGGDSGRVILAGDPDGSGLYRRISSEQKLKRMPPAALGPLPNEKIELIRRWISQGAQWPAEASPSAGAASDHWSYQPIQRPAAPAVSAGDWPRSPIDNFVLARLESEGLAPSPEANRYTLIRRLYYDLLGLPPDPQEVDDFINDRAPNAYERVVERLLQSPHFGERWGRHWLDMARYADSDGYEKDRPRPNAWRYRDWVIEAINRDMPLDQFTIEQLAGDLLPDATPSQKLATAFHRQTLTNTEGGVDPEEFRVAAIVDRVNTTGSVWLGVTVGCAQCHSHKYDRVTQREYYQLFAFFNNADETDLQWPDESDQSDSQNEETKTDEEKKKEAAARRVRVIRERGEDPRKTHILRRGDFLSPMDEVRPATLEVLHPLRPRDPENTPDRLDLALWLVDPANPLTPRVLVNHIWARLFGRGLVETASDFGVRGALPSHPELLDWLAADLLERKWSRKAIIRRIVNSAVYRQSSAHRTELVDKDPLNTLLYRQNRFRVEAEIVRDLHLAASGLLVRQVGGPSVYPPLPPGVAELSYANSFKWKVSEGESRYRRGMYTFFKRTAPHPNLISFDCPDSNSTCIERRRANTPLQALTTLNNEVFAEAARAMAVRVLANEPCANDAQRVSRAFRLCVARPPSDFERNRFLDLLAASRDYYARHREQAVEAVGDVAIAGLPADEAAAWIATARIILNTDEFISRE